MRKAIRPTFEKAWGFSIRTNGIALRLCYSEKPAVSTGMGRSGIEESNTATDRLPLQQQEHNNALSNTQNPSHTTSYIAHLSIQQWTTDAAEIALAFVPSFKSINN